MFGLERRIIAFGTCLSGPKRQGCTQIAETFRAGLCFKEQRPPGQMRVLGAAALPGSYRTCTQRLPKKALTDRLLPLGMGSLARSIVRYCGIQCGLREKVVPRFSLSPVLFGRPCTSRDRIRAMPRRSSRRRPKGPKERERENILLS